MEPRIQYAQTEDGVSIAYWTMGSGLPFVEMPTPPWSHVQLELQVPLWRAWDERLAEQRTHVRYDHRGTGLSARDVTEISLETLVFDLEAVVDHLALEKFVLFGHHITGAAAIAYAAKRPERVSQLILWCSYPKSGVEPRAQTRALSALLREDWETYTETLAHTVFGWSQGEEAHRFAGVMRECSTSDIARAYFNAEFDVGGVLASVKCPTLVVQRRGYQLVSIERAQELCSKIPHAQLALLEGTTGVTYMEDMEALAVAIDEFLDDGDREGAQASAPAQVEDSIQKTLTISPPEAKTFASGRYVVVKPLGQGAQKSVYLVRDTVLDRECALATLNPDLLDPSDVVRIRNEAQTMAQFGSQVNIVTVYDYGEDGDTPYIVCEYVTGGDLRAELTRHGGPLPLDRALAVASDICGALAFAHRRGIIHRDMKPENVYIDDDGRAKLGDFGMAIAAGRSRLTVAGQVTGTPWYMAPEQASGASDLDARTDLYSFGAMLYELVTGRPPFLGDSPMAVMSQQIHAVPQPPSEHNPSIPASLQGVIMNLLAKNKDRRPASAEAVLAELERAASELREGGESGATAASQRVEEVGAREVRLEQTGPITFLYIDLVNSIELLQRIGDEPAQRIFEEHRKTLRSAISSNSGSEVKWRGEGIMVAFGSSADAVRCAISIQQEARRPIQGERLDVRIGVNVGEAPGWDEEEYFGTPAVVASRLCTEASTGQILCSSLVSGLLAGRRAFQFRQCGELELKDIVEPVSASEVLYEQVQPGALLRHAPFVGRQAEMARLNDMLKETLAGHGGLFMVVGEPGIGKTRAAEELTETARQDGATVLWGHCYDGESARPYGPFAEAIEEYSRAGDVVALHQDLGLGAGAIARLVPTLHQRLSGIAEPPSLQADEERFRLLDAVSQFLIAASERAPVVLVVDDLHWADKGTVAMLRHVARFAQNHRILLIGTYREMEVDRQHPLTEALGAFPRETNFERVLLKGLETLDVGKLLSNIGEQELPQALVKAIHDETDGNPFFIREVLLFLIQEGRIVWEEGRWKSDFAISEIGIPEGVRQVISRRLSRLSEDANHLLTGASAFSGPFQFDIAATLASLEEMPALDAIDQALEAQIIQPGSEPETFGFAHALIRQTLYEGLSPPRQVRLHRRIAETMEASYAEQTGEHAAELAYQYHRSAALPGAERGVPYALVATERAEAAYAHDNVTTFLRMALELLPDDDPQRPALLGRVGMALAWTLDLEEALKAATAAGELFAAKQGGNSAADYLAQAARTMWNAGFSRGAWDLAGRGLEYTGDRRDATWAWLMFYDLLRREAEDPDNPGIPLDIPERQELAEVAERLPPDQRSRAFIHYSSRDEILARAGDDPTLLTYYAGEYRRSLNLWQEQAALNEQRGQIANALSDWAQTARCHNALGDFAAAAEALEKAVAFAARLAGPSPQALQIFSARLDLRFTVEPDSPDYLAETTPLLQQPAVEHAWAAAVIRAVAALAYAWQGDTEEALRWLSTTIASLERAPGWAYSYPLLAGLCASALWWLKRTDHIEVIERNLRLKVIEPDFRFPMQDGRLSMAHLCALQGRYEEASDWFGQARTVLDEQGARPLRAITDLGEAEMYFRRAAPGDDERAKPLLDAAIQQFRSLGMTGWLRLAERTDVSAQA